MWRIIKQTRARIDAGQTTAPLPKRRELFRDWTVQNSHVQSDCPDTGQNPSGHIINDEAIGGLYQKSNRSSHSSDTSSAYSGSDTMHSSVQSSTEDGSDLSGLHESVVDSDDEEDLSKSYDSLAEHDKVRECLEREPAKRSKEDVEVLLEIAQNLKAFANMTVAVRRALCAAMVFAEVEKAGSVVMRDGEELDMWSVLIDGHVEVEQANGVTRQLNVGDCFGISPTMKKMYHRGVMKTKTDFCQFVCIAQEAYYRIQHQGEENIHRHETVKGVVDLVTEMRTLDDDVLTSGVCRQGHMAIRGTPERLTQELVEEKLVVDPTFVEDFLLTHRTFIRSSLTVAQKLLEGFGDDPESRNKVTRVLLLWINNHFTDFELDPAMMELLEEFEERLERAKMQGQLKILNAAYAANARARTVILARPDRNENLPFAFTGGAERGCGIFIFKVDKKSKAEDIGLKRGDQILAVNGQNFENITNKRALEVLRGSTHLSITVKSNLLELKEISQRSELLPSTSRATPQSPTIPNQNRKSNSSTQRTKEWLRKSVLNVFSHVQTEKENNGIDLPELQALKIYSSDQLSRYLLVRKETTAKEVVQEVLLDFGITEASGNFSLCEVSVAEGGFVKQRRLPDQLQNLSERIGLSSRYYLKNNNSTEQLVPDDVALELVKESAVSFLQLNAVEVAVQLTLQDFDIFRQIESTEYVDDLFELKSKYGTPMLTQFANLVNKEMFWVVTEVCSEHSPHVRMKIIKRFIKLARLFKINKNFNSMFNIVAGLGHRSVSRLKATWERLPEKHQKLFSDLQDLMDPSRNMSKYRQLVSTSIAQLPVIPFYPIVKKDLTFIQLGNDSKVEGLINFEKLRMVAKEIRSMARMCSAPYDRAAMLERTAELLAGQSSTSAALKVMQTATVRRRRKSEVASSNARKKFEEAQMVRQVKAYLQHLKVVSDEDRLEAMSLECEPPAPAPASMAATRRRPPSPTLSTTSTTSVASGRLVSASPKVVIKAPKPAKPHRRPQPHLPASPPASLRKMGHGRSHSDTPNDICAKSSSVTNLSKDSGLSMKESPPLIRRHSAIIDQQSTPTQKPRMKPLSAFNEAARLSKAHSHEGVLNDHRTSYQDSVVAEDDELQDSNSQ